MRVIDTQAVQQHYRRLALRDSIIAALERAGKDIARLTPDDLAPIDEFHTRGRPGTVELAELVGFAGGQRVLDLGSGLGGPSRFLASRYGCRVSGVDLTPEFVAMAIELARLTRLEDKVDYRQGDALALPFDAEDFDVVWSQNVAMNISDRERLYSQVHRVLRAGGKYAFSDVVSDVGGEPYYPMPWARDAGSSHLRSAEATREALIAAGFTVCAWKDATEVSARAAFERAEAASRPPLGLHVLFGEDWSAISANMLRNYEERRIGVLLGVVERIA